MIILLALLVREDAGTCNVPKMRTNAKRIAVSVLARRAVKCA